MELNVNIFKQIVGSKMKSAGSSIINYPAAIERTGNEAIGQDSLARSVLLHLLPGVLLLAFYLAAGPVAISWGYPPEVAVLIGTLVILIPVELRRLWLKSGKSLSLKGAVNYGRFVGWKQYLIWVPAMIVWSFIAWGLAAPADALITQNLLGWAPAWFTTASDFSQYSRNALAITLGLNLLVNGLLAPVVEELYFRGHLLPGIGRYGRWAPAMGAILFTIYHLWQPMIYLQIFLAMLPWIYLVWLKKDVRIGIGVHCAINMIGAILTFGLYLG